MFEADFIYDSDDGGYDTALVTTGVLGWSVTEAIGAYVEGIGIGVTDSDTDYIALLGLGGTYLLTPDIQLDANVNIGLTSAAPDVTVSTGITIRF